MTNGLIVGARTSVGLVGSEITGPGFVGFDIAKPTNSSYGLKKVCWGFLLLRGILKSSK